VGVLEQDEKTTVKPVRATSHFIIRKLVMEQK
jgi:hypothetical protein